MELELGTGVDSAVGRRAIEAASASTETVTDATER